MNAEIAYCQACLSADRDLCPLEKIEGLIQYNSLWELLSARGGICWECNQLIKKWSEFRHQVQKAQKLLQCNVQIFCLAPLSRLSKSQNQYTSSHDPITNQEFNEEEETTKQLIDQEKYIEKEEFKIKDEIDVKPLSPINETSDHDEIFDELNFSESDKPITRKNVDTKNRVKRKVVKQKIGKESEEEVRDKFTIVVFTEEEMLKNREEKRNHPNFKKIPYKCDSCVLGFLRKETYEQHLEKKHKENISPHTCPVCLIRFTSQKQVARHRSKHYVCYRCKLCKYETLEMWSALSHCRTKHVEDQVESIHCSYCVFVAKSPEELSAHTTAEHALYCDDCGEKFKARGTLRSHIRRIHRVKREFTCSLCSKAFKSRSRLESHTANHNAVLAQKLAYCALCDVQYKNIYVYRNHLKTSANHAEQSYQCKECNKQFASKVYWKKHYNFYHLHQSQFHCDICDKLFISDWRLKNHRQTQHGLSRSRDHHCSVCGKQFFTLSTLKAHQLTHSEQRSFMCEDCGDTFKQRPALYTHCKLVHQGLKRRKYDRRKKIA